MSNLKDLKRMCLSHKACENCPLYIERVSHCSPYQLNSNVEEIVDKWIQEHPTKTYSMDFFEHFPNAPRDIDGTPKICRRYVYGDGTPCYSTDCIDCWNRDMPEDN